MKETIAKWMAWLKKATAQDDERLGSVYSDGGQLWATNGYVLHALDVATGKRGRVTLSEAGSLQVEKDGDLPPFAGALPRAEPAASIIVSAESLRAAAEGQEGFDCTPEQVALTGPDSALRPGLHACAVGTLYGWSLHGRAPAGYDYIRHGYQTLHWPDGREEIWPATAFVQTTGLSYEERRDLEQVALELEKGVHDGRPGYKKALLQTMRGLLERPLSQPLVAYHASFPDAGRLNDGEKYLLHRWLVKREEGHQLVYGYPVWLVVTATDSPGGGWRVVHDDVCPGCGRRVLPEHPARDGNRLSHRWCRELWEELGWQPASFRRKVPDELATVSVLN